MTLKLISLIKDKAVATAWDPKALVHFVRCDCDLSVKLFFQLERYAISRQMFYYWLHSTNT